MTYGLVPFPSILIPFPYATDQHQDKNAEFMEQRVGGARKLAEEDLTPNALAAVISKLLANNKAPLLQMEENIKKFREENRSRDLCSVVCEVAGTKVR